jgi:hypothetical protein
MAIRRLILEVAKTIWRSLPLQMALVFLPLLWIGYFALTASEKADALQQARSHGDSIADLFQENTERIFERIDQSLLILRAMYASEPETFSLKFWARRARIASGDVVQFSLIGLDGYMSDTTSNYSGPPLYLGDREHFLGALAEIEDRLYVARPVLGRASHQWTIQVARKLLSADGNCVGVLVGSIDVDLVGRFYDRQGSAPAAASFSGMRITSSSRHAASSRTHCSGSARPARSRHNWGTARRVNTGA